MNKGTDITHTQTNSQQFALNLDPSLLVVHLLHPKAVGTDHLKLLMDLVAI